MNKSELKAKNPVRLKRMAKGMYQYELAERLNVRPAAVSRWETHGVATLKTAKKIAAVLGCDWRELFDDDAPACTCADKK